MNKMSSNKVSVKCEKCNHIGERSKYSWRGCLYCVNQKRCSGEIDCKFCENQSFASCDKYIHLYIENGTDEDKYIKARSYSKYSHYKEQFKCDKCQHIFESSIYHICKYRWCPFCANQRLCDNNNCKICFSKSAASDEKFDTLLYEDVRKIFKNSNTKYNFRCNACFHIYQMSPTQISNNTGCPYCSRRKLCGNCWKCIKKSFASHDKSKFLVNPDKELGCIFLNSHVKYLFYCKDCDDTFLMRINSIASRESWCPNHKNKTELIIYRFLKQRGYNFIKEAKFNWSENRRFDFYLYDYKLILEIDGPQHYKPIPYFNTKNSFEELQQIDKWKDEKALENGLQVVRMNQEDIWFDRINWKQQIVNLLN